MGKSKKACMSTERTGSVGPAVRQASTRLAYQILSERTAESLVGRVYRLESEFEGIKTISSVPWASRGPLAAFCIHGGPPGLGDLPLGTGSFVASPPQGNPCTASAKTVHH